MEKSANEYGLWRVIWMSEWCKIEMTNIYLTRPFHKRHTFNRPNPAFKRCANNYTEKCKFYVHDEAPPRPTTTNQNQSCPSTNHRDEISMIHCRLWARDRDSVHIWLVCAKVFGKVIKSVHESEWKRFSADFWYISTKCRIAGRICFGSLDKASVNKWQWNHFEKNKCSTKICVCVREGDRASTTLPLTDEQN